MMTTDVDESNATTAFATTCDDHRIKNHQNQTEWLQEFPYDACVSSNQPTPLDLVRYNLPIALNSNASSTKHSKTAFDESKLQMLINQLLWSPNKIQDKLSQMSLREIQVQIMLRLELYSLAREAFLSQYALFVKHSLSSHLSSLVDKHTRRRYRHLLKQSKSMTPVQIVVNQVQELLSRAIFQLDAKTPFVSFCRDCLPQHLFASIPVVMQDILDGFEIRNPWQELEKSDDQAISELYLSPVKKQGTKKRRSMTSSSSLMDREGSNTVNDDCTHNEITGSLDNQHLLAASTTTSKSSRCDTIHSLVQQPTLATNFTTTIRKRNSLVKDGGKPRLLASHFNAKLSNVSTLFRQVQMTGAAPKQQPPPPLKSQPKLPPQKGLLRHNSTSSTTHSTSKRKLLVPPPRDGEVSRSAGTMKRSKSDMRPRDSNHASHHNRGSRPCPAVANKNDRRAFAGAHGESSSSSPRRRVVCETPLKPTTDAQQRRSSHPLTPLGISNCVVQETPTKNIAAKSLAATSPFWDRDKLLAEASQVLRRNQRKDDTIW